MRKKWSQRGVTDECLTLSVIALTRAGAFKKGPGSVWNSTREYNKSEITSRLNVFVLSSALNEQTLLLYYDLIDPASGAKLPVKCSVRLTTTTPPNFGGLRYWFICPLVSNGQPCQRRIGRLYLPRDGRYFGCRKCYNLTYRSQRTHNKKNDALMKLPIDELHREIKSSNPLRAKRAKTAAIYLYQKLSKKSSKRPGETDMRLEELKKLPLGKLPPVIAPPKINRREMRKILRRLIGEHLKKKRQQYREREKQREKLSRPSIGDFLPLIASPGFTLSMLPKSLRPRKPKKRKKRRRYWW